jgi:hypothetical protein
MGESETAKAVAAIADDDLQKSDPARINDNGSFSDLHWQLDLPTDDETAKLVGLGIPEAAIWEPWPIRVANVIFREHLFD